MQDMIKKRQTIVVVDFGSPTARNLARLVRENKVFSVILPPDTDFDRFKGPIGMILTGDPGNGPIPEGVVKLFGSGIPIMAFGPAVRVLLSVMKGEAAAGETMTGSVDKMLIKQVNESPLIDKRQVGQSTSIIMRHGDIVSRLPAGFEVLANTPTCPHAVIGNVERKLYAAQVLPEEGDTLAGCDLLRGFLHNVCGARGEWEMSSHIDECVREVREQVKDGRVVLGLSGGVDSSVTAAIISKAIGDRLSCVFVDHGLLRKNEFENVLEQYNKYLGMKVIAVRAGDRFLKELAGVTDPEEKRRIIGRLFVEVFEEEASKIQGVSFLAQGTVYPDVIESISARGDLAVKSHHNVGGLPEKLGFELIEPLREMFKDEVREMGLALGLPESIIWRHPFPGPGLAVRIVGDITPKRVAVLQEVDAILNEELVAAHLYRSVWQSFPVLLPISSTGVENGERQYKSVVALRVVHSVDAMEAEWYRMPFDLMERLSSRILKEVPEVGRVVYDISSKPPATIEWE